MSEYEKWSLALTAIGHLFVASSIIYAVKSWVLSQKSFEREIKGDTRNYLMELDGYLRSARRDILNLSIEVSELPDNVEKSIYVNKYLNIIEGVHDEIETEFFDSEMIKKFIYPHAARAWSEWKEHVYSRRAKFSNPKTWMHVEIMAESYNKALQRTSR